MYRCTQNCNRSIAIVLTGITLVLRTNPAQEIPLTKKNSCSVGEHFQKTGRR